MKKNLIVLASILLSLVVLFPSAALPWGSATHAYIDDHIGKKLGFRNMNEIYGGMAPDVFNYMFYNPAYKIYLSYQTHEEFMKEWNAARLETGKASTYGFVSHNDLWGSDSTAHYSCILCGEDKGYIVAKAETLESFLYDTLDALGLGGPEYYLLRIELYHNLVEAAGDILIKREDKFIGQKIIYSAILRSPAFPVLLVKAYAKDFSQYAGIGYIEAVNIIAWLR